MPETYLALAALKKQRSTNKGKLTSLVKYAREDHSDTSLSDLTTRSRRVEQLMLEFTDLELRIFTENPDEESDINYEENYYTAISTLNKWIRAKNLNPDVIDLDLSHNVTQNGEHSSQVKLPKIHIPSFSGDYSEWQSFHDMFATTIHESPNLSPVQKFQYLKGLLRGEAAVLLRHITVTEGNYIGALNKLKERYDRKKHIVNNFIRTFIEQPAIQHSNASNIKRIMDTSDEVIRGLKALGEIGEKRDPWLIYIILQKLDDKTKALWAEKSADIINPEFAEFLKFLGRRTDTLESLVTTTKRTTQRSVNVKSCVASEESEKAIEGFAAFKPLNNYPCAMCQKEGHTIFHCNEFHLLDLNGRNEFIKKTNRCFNCFGTHSIIRCPSRRRCQKCRKKHNTLLHHEETKDDSQHEQPTTSNDKQVFHSQGANTSAILPTAIVEIVDDYGRIIPCRALLDSGSQASFITEGCAQRLRLKKRNARIPITGLGQSGSVISKGLVTINIRPNAFPEFSIETLVIPKIPSQLPTQNLHIKLKTSPSLKLADPQFNKRSNIDVLIGADHFFDILQDGQIKTSVNEPVLQNTIFGWVVSGQARHSTDDGAISMLVISPNEREMFNIDLSLRRFWELESVNTSEKILSPEETFCENHFVKNMKRDPQGRFIVNLPFKKSPDILGDSLTSAIHRLRGVERRFIRDPSFARLYHDFMAEYQQLNHMIEVSSSESSENGFYLPHHGVLKGTSTTSKMRVVFDASVKSTTGISLNNCLATGPYVQSSLYAIILRFREHKVAFSADVEKMYRQVRLSPDDTPYQKIVWRSNPSEAIRHFRLLTVTYGLSSASFLATRPINQVSKDNMASSPQAASVIANDVYVDDLMSGADDEESAEVLKNKIAEILTQYGFHLRKWKSNSPKILINAPHEPQKLKHKEIQDRVHKDTETVKVLGINWNHETDCFTFIAEVPDATKFTKRTVLSEASRLFDPMGWLAPVVITFKIFMQMLWADSMDWDDPLPHKKHILWSTLRSNLKTINAISIPRFILTFKDFKIDLHGFCDASRYAYAAAVYFRIEDSIGNTSVHLISAKTKVAPIKQQTIPRLELCAAVSLANLIEIVKSETNMNLREIFAWTDSQIVLDWLGSHPRRWSTFIGNRTATILTNLPRKSWRHVPTANNPADCASRGMSPSELQSHALWWNGSDWLKLTSNLWPPQQNDYGHCEEY